MHYYQHHIGDFDRATRHLSRIERSIYRDLIDVYYDTEQALTRDVAALCRKVVARSEEEKAAVLAVLDEFFIDTPNGWFHDDCAEAIAEYHKKSSQASEAGKASAVARAQRRMEAMTVAVKPNENPTDVERTLNGRTTENQQDVNEQPTNHKPLTTNQKPKVKIASPSALPDWIPIPAWEGFLAMRKQVKKPITLEAIPLAIKKLEELRKAGNDPASVLEQSTLHCWQGLFEVKGSAAASPKVKDWE